MARFYASIRGGRGTATRIGRQSITGHIRGWRTGVEVDCQPDIDSGRDVCFVYRTGGSSGAIRKELIAEVRENKIRFVKRGR
jgi:hypothetical protein